MSTNLNNAEISDDLPAPVLPTNAIFSSGLISNSMFFKTGY